jgi:tetratricopeptide (TPR) repeat protein
MHTDRITQLQQFYEEDPNDPFNLYALALEYLKVDPAMSRSCFETLMQAHPRYLPVYYHAGKLYQESGEKEKAIGVFQKGMRLAEDLNDSKTLRELKSAYDELMFE